MRYPLLAVVLALLAAGAGADEPAAERPSPEAEFRAAWVAFTDPAAAVQGSGTLAARQRARTTALPHIEAAVAEEPDDARYRAAMVYLYLAAGKYQRAADAVAAAIAGNRDDPLLYLLKAQALATLGHAAPETAGDWVGEAVAALDEAARLDAENALAPAEAASIAFDGDRPDLAVERLDQAIARSGLRLYRLPIAEELDEDPYRSVRRWQYAQYAHWMELLARAENAAQGALKLGREKETANDPEAAEALYRRALELGRLVGRAEPNSVVTVNSGINICEQAYLHLGKLAEKTGSSDAQRWQGEWGVLQIARGELSGALQQYLDTIKQDPPESREQALEMEAESVRRALLGAGFATAEPEAPADAADPSHDQDEEQVPAG